MSETPTPTSTPTPKPETRVVDTGLIARMGAKTSRLNQMIKTKDATIAQLQKDLGDARQSADGSASAKRVKELEGQLRQRDHRAAFDRVARSEGAGDDALEDLWSLTKVDTDGEPDEAKLKELVAAHKAHPTRGRLFGAAESEAETETPAEGSGSVTPPVVKKPVPGSGRGEQRGHGAPAVSQDLVKSDPVYVMNNYDRIVAAAKANLNGAR